MKTFGGKRGAPLARQHGIELFAQAVQVTHIARRVFLLLGREHCLAPIAALLLLGDFLTEQITAQILEAMAIRKRAHQAGGNFGAVNRRRDNPKILLQNRDIKPREVKQLHPRRVAQKLHQIGGVVLPRQKLDEMLIPSPVRQLHEAEPIALVVEAHGLGIDRNIAGKTDGCG